VPGIDDVPFHLPLELCGFGYPRSMYASAVASGEHFSWPQRAHSAPPSPSSDPAEQNADSEFAIGVLFRLLRTTHASHSLRRDVARWSNA
jgi:hypothetical protein